MPPPTTLTFDILKEFFEQDLPFTPTPRQVREFEADLARSNPAIMRDALKELANGSKLRRPDEWRKDLFAVYYRKVTEQARLFPLFHTFETAFRSRVAIRLDEYYETKRWWAPIRSAIASGQPVQNISLLGTKRVSSDAKKLIERIILSIEGDHLQGNQTVSCNDGFSFMELCSLKQILHLIDTHWFLFSPIFARPRILTRNDFVAKFKRVMDSRNDTYHHKSISRTSLVVDTAEQLLDYLDLSLSFVYKQVEASKLSPLSFHIPIQQRHATWA